MSNEESARDLSQRIHRDIKKTQDKLRELANRDHSSRIAEHHAVLEGFLGVIHGLEVAVLQLSSHLVRLEDRIESVAGRVDGGDKAAS